MRYGSMREGDFGLLFRGSFPISTVLFFPKVFILSNPKVLGAFECGNQKWRICGYHL